MKRLPIDPDLLRDRLAPAQGKQYWRSLEELAEEPAVRDMLQREFPDGASEWTDPVSRRRFLTLMGASLALAGMSGCMRPPTGKIMPFVRQPENLVLGKPLYYATSMTLSGYATGLLVESHEGRPTKIEGNPQHPASLGATTAMQQASVLGLYDPDRAQTLTFRAKPQPWGKFTSELRDRLGPKSGREKGQKVAILTEAVGSPTLDAQLKEFLDDHPLARWFRFEPVNRDNVTNGIRIAFGNVDYSFRHVMEQANIIVSLSADFLASGPACLTETRAFTSRRRNGGGKAGFNRLYVIETDVTITGAKADHRLPLKPSEVETFARALAAKLGVPGIRNTGKLSERAEKHLDAIAADLEAHRGKSLLVVGEMQTPAVHAIAHAINHRLENVGKTIIYTPPVYPTAAQKARKLDVPDESMKEIAELTRLITNEEIDTLIILGGNPAYTAPADIDFAGRLRAQLKQPVSRWLAVHCSPYFDETAELCHWHVAQSHYLEAWSDAVAFDGTKSIVQPLIAPLYATKSLHEVLASISRRKDGGSVIDFDDRAALEIVRDYWRGNQPADTKKDDFDTFWQKSLHEGVIAGTAAKPVIPLLDNNLAGRIGPGASESAPLEIAFAPDPGVYDGRFSNLGWLQEWPRPITKLTWDNAALMSLKTAADLGVTNRVGNWHSGGEHGDMLADRVTLKVGNKDIVVPVFLVPGHADGAITLYLGYGRTKAGKVGNKVGVNANILRTSSAAWAASVTVTKARGEKYQLACVQGHHSMEGRDIVRSGDVEAYKKDPYFQRAHEHGHGHGKDEEGHPGQRHPLPTLIKPHEYPGYKWGMAVDLTACTGCGACVTACQSENNTPVVGTKEVTRGREMHWLRIDRYIELPKNRLYEPPRSWHFQPVMCQHCENAPCEMVCPVEATAHGDEGTNDMVYNRCVGTRYCSHNCPYKVRRFNFLQYTDFNTPSLKLLYNPEVTVRTRGVMEKCSFCIQRVSYARIEAAKEAMDELDLPHKDRKRRDTNGKDGQPRRQDGKEIPYIRDGEILTACQSACPADAIVFGDLNDHASRVHKLHESPLQYELLREHGVRPRVAYLGELRNPNPKLKEE